MAHRGGTRIATTAAALTATLAVTAACGRPGDAGQESPASPAPAAPVLQLRLVTSAEPVGERPCPTAGPAPSAPAELCERTGPMLFRLGRSVAHAPVRAAGADQSGGRWVVNIQLTDEDGAALATATSGNVGKQLAMVVDARVLSAPIIADPIRNGAIQLAADFTEQQARDLAKQLTPS